MKQLTRITLNPEVMGGKPCIRGLRVTVGTVIGLMASGYSTEDILKAYPYLEAEDLREALAYAAWHVEETELPLVSAGYLLHSTKVGCTFVPFAVTPLNEAETPGGTVAG
ncbi:DUF433 domain-containing protein [Trichocoleus sp. FACHB-6]|nr:MULTISPECIES: DUF433 domain-containing protein [unclassified Trichocoleus]MBD1904193.1 DUF433 domain-containing protein [Trichocoleus sp. FACHB-832]MBD2061157.1 DUF433 domain-containing protein [Trichocoleus sp. FACHB-6]